MPGRILVLLAIVLMMAAPAAQAGRHARADATAVPLTDLNGATYLGFEGGLYPGGSNVMPDPHSAEGLARASRIQPLDTSGRPNPNGKYVLLSIGMSNTTQEFCGTSTDGVTCETWTFMGQAAQDGCVNKTHLVVLDGAAGGQVAEYWDDPAEPNYDRVRDDILNPHGLSEKQVQIVWLKVANDHPEDNHLTSLSGDNPDATMLLAEMGNIARAAKVRYPNLQMVFVSSRIYGGYATSTLNPEPYAYESGFAVKWLIEAQIDQMQNEGALVDPRAGDLNYDTVAPWLAWGPYLWANGLQPRSDGLTWAPADFEERDYTHPDEPGETKVGVILLGFFRSSPFTVDWFVNAATCHRAFLPAVQKNASGG